jgi:glycosyltransferase involved in cell wall biosynthesis
VFNYMPEWEGVSKEIESLRRGLEGDVDSSLLSLNTKVGGLTLRGCEKRVPLPHGLALYPLLKPYAAQSGINHLFASAGERWLTPVLARYDSVLTVAKDTTSLRGYERNTEYFLKYRAIVVQGERDRELMREVGVREEALWLIRPGIPVVQYHEAPDPFTILFASSPLTAEHFLSRGIYLMVRAAARLPEVRFLLVWRRQHLLKLKGIIASAGVRNIEILDGVVPDMGILFDQVHATILPALEHRSFIPCPRSALESLAHGKPLLVSDFVSLARRVARSGAGVAFDPIGDGVEAAIRRLRTNYAAYQARTQPYLARHFCPKRHVELHRQLYQTIVQ